MAKISKAKGPSDGKATRAAISRPTIDPMPRASRESVEVPPKQAAEDTSGVPSTPPAKKVVSGKAKAKMEVKTSGGK